MNLFFDLDGTLLDVRLRLYRLFCDLAGSAPVSFEQYWQLKKKGLLQKDILQQVLHYNEQQITTFQNSWMQKVELQEYLRLDRLFSFTVPVLEACKSKNKNLYLVTARQNRINLEWQLQELKIHQFFTHIFQVKGTMPKHEPVAGALIPVQAQDLWIGDTAADIAAARQLGILSMAVRSGEQSEESLEAEHPDWMADNISQLVDYLETS